MSGICFKITWEEETEGMGEGLYRDNKLMMR